MLSYEEAKNIIVWIVGIIGTGIAALFLWLAKSTHEKWQEMTSWHEANKEVSISSIKNEISTMKLEQANMKNDIHRGWLDQREHMDNNQKILLEKIEHANGNSKQSMEFMGKLLSMAEDRIKNLEDKK